MYFAWQNCQNSSCLLHFKIALPFICHGFNITNFKRCSQNVNQLIWFVGHCNRYGCGWFINKIVPIVDPHTDLWKKTTRIHLPRVLMLQCYLLRHTGRTQYKYNAFDDKNTAANNWPDGSVRRYRSVNLSCGATRKKLNEATAKLYIVLCFLAYVHPSLAAFFWNCDGESIWDKEAPITNKLGAYTFIVKLKPYKWIPLEFTDTQEFQHKITITLRCTKSCFPFVWKSHCIGALEEE